MDRICERVRDERSGAAGTEDVGRMDEAWLSVCFVAHASCKLIHRLLTIR